MLYNKKLANTKCTEKSRKKLEKLNLKAELSNVQKLRSALTFIIKEAQTIAFLRHSSNLKAELNAFNAKLDAKGIICGESRIEDFSALSTFQKRPILLNKSCHLTKLLVQNVRDVNHASLRETITEVARFFQIKGLRVLAKNIIRHCLECNLT